MLLPSELFQIAQFQNCLTYLYILACPYPDLRYLRWCCEMFFSGTMISPDVGTIYALNSLAHSSGKLPFEF